MATPSVSESAVAEFSAVSTVSLTVNAAAGALLVAAFAEQTGNRPFSVNDATNGANKDSQNNSWTALTENTEPNNAFRTRIFYAANVASGSTTVRLRQDGSFSATGQAVLLEVANASTTAPFDVESQQDNASGSTTHYAAASGAIDTAADVLVLACGVMQVDRGTPTKKDANWTRLTPSGTNDNRYMFQYRTSSSALTDERGEWTQPSAGSAGCAVIASFKAGAGGTTDAAGTIAATSSASGTSAATAASSSTIAALATAAGVALAIVGSAGTASATTTATGTASSAWAASSTVVATSTAAATATATAESAGAVTATATATGVGEAVGGSSALGTVTVTSAATGVASATAASVGLVAVLSTATGVGEGTAQDAAVGIVTVTTSVAGVATSTAAALGTIIATATATAVGQDAAMPTIAADADTWRARSRPTAWRARSRPTAWKAKP